MPFQEELSRELRKTTKAKLAVLLPTYHRHAEIAPSDPEVQLAAEVRARARTLQEIFSIYLRKGGREKHIAKI
jgi:hypothetical protein